MFWRASAYFVFLPEKFPFSGFFLRNANMDRRAGTLLMPCKELCRVFFYALSKIQEKEYSEHTKHDFRVAIKKFWRFLRFLINKITESVKNSWYKDFILFQSHIEYMIAFDFLWASRKKPSRNLSYSSFV